MTNEQQNILAFLVVFGWMFVFVGLYILYGLMWVGIIIYQMYHILRYGKQA